MCGCLIEKSSVMVDRAFYGLAMMGTASLLVLSTILEWHPIAPFLVSAACGLQNGMATSYSGAVIRTTHVTGIATDVGLISGRLLMQFCRTRCAKWHVRELRTGSVGTDFAEDLKKLFLLGLLGMLPSWG